MLVDFFFHGKYFFRHFRFSVQRQSVSATNSRLCSVFIQSITKAEKSSRVNDLLLQASFKRRVVGFLLDGLASAGTCLVTAEYVLLQLYAGGEGCATLVALERLALIRLVGQSAQSCFP